MKDSENLLRNQEFLQQVTKRGKVELNSLACIHKHPSEAFIAMTARMNIEIFFLLLVPS